MKDEETEKDAEEDQRPPHPRCNVTVTDIEVDKVRVVFQENGSAKGFFRNC